MATKKAGTTKKKTTAVKAKSDATAKPSTTTKVTTVKAVAADKPAATTSRRLTNKTFIASALAAEFIGSFLFTAAFMGTKGDPLYLGFTLVGIVLMIVTLSGAHINPVVTVGAWVTRKVTSLRALGYIAAQVLGATLAFVTLRLFIAAAPASDSQSAMLGQASPQLFKVATLTDKNQWFVFFAELIAATIFAFAVAGARRIASADRTARALTFGLGLLAAGIFGTITAGYAQANIVFNPAVALAVQAIDWSNFNVVAAAAYIIAPLIGGVLGFGLREVLSAGEDKRA